MNNVELYLVTGKCMTTCEPFIYWMASTNLGKRFIFSDSTLIIIIIIIFIIISIIIIITIPLFITLITIVNNYKPW